MKKKLSNKITFFVLGILVIVISFMVLFTYHTFKNFYKGQLSIEVIEELATFTKLLEEGIDESLVSRLIIEKDTQRDIYILYFNENFNLIFSSHQLEAEKLKNYQKWVAMQVDDGGEQVHYVDTGMDFHIPHVWAYQSVERNGVIEGYFFIDRDTGDFEKAKQQLAILLLSMGLFTLLIGVLLTIYLTKVISKPLITIGKTTREIAKGDFDIQLSISTDDEVGQLAEDIREMTKQLKEFRDSKREFISHISHDLRTPVTYIKGYSAIMRDLPEINEADLRRNLDVIYNESKRIESLVTDLFQLTKLEEGRIVLEKELTDITLWIESIIASRQLMLDHQSITCHVTASSENIKASIDPQRLGQAVINLIENSIRYTPKNGLINIRIREESGRVIIEIEDNGIGIPKEELPKIWQRFYRVDKARSRDRAGSGLGLAIVKEIVELHGGQVNVKSTEGEGTVFSLSL